MLVNKKISVLVFAMFTGAAFVISGCEKNTIVVIPLKPETITKTVSFSKDLVPIFTGSCVASGCHGAGGHVPVLTPDLAYASLISGNYINKGAPESSIIYERLTGAATPIMPAGGAANPGNIEGLMLAWIRQGAKKN